MLFATLSLALALIPSAEATYTPKIKNIRIRQTTGDGNTGSYLSVLVQDLDNTVDSVVADLEKESLALSASDVWLHGTSALSMLPLDGDAVTLTLYDVDSVAMGVFLGTVSEGALVLTQRDDRGDGGDCSARTGCTETGGGDSAIDAAVSVTFADAETALWLDFSGVDLLDVASASLSVETYIETDVCAVVGRDGSCLLWETEAVTEDAVVDFDDLGYVWDGAFADWDGAASLKLRVEDAAGKKLEQQSLDVAPAWVDEGTGQSAVVFDNASGAVVCVCDRTPNWNAFDATAQELSALVVSDGWLLGDDLPEVASVALEGGETWELPAQSYQVTGVVALDEVFGEPLSFTIDDVEATAIVEDDAGRFWATWESLPYVVIVEADADGVLWASVTAWSADPTGLPESVALASNGVPLASSLEGEEVSGVAMDSEIAVVFGIDVTLDAGAFGADILGEVVLQGAANKKGRRADVVRGSFAGQIGVDADGDVDLASIGKGDATVARGDILIGGEPIGIEREVGGEVLPTAPPVVLYKNGIGTRNMATANTTKPGLL